jgi:hypothetical protein
LAVEWGEWLGDVASREVRRAMSSGVTRFGFLVTRWPRRSVR